ERVLWRAAPTHRARRDNLAPLVQLKLPDEFVCSHRSQTAWVRVELNEIVLADHAVFGAASRQVLFEGRYLVLDLQEPSHAPPIVKTWQAANLRDFPSLDHPPD